MKGNYFQTKYSSKPWKMTSASGLFLSKIKDLDTSCYFLFNIKKKKGINFLLSQIYLYMSSNKK